MLKTNNKNLKKGFTLIEVLLVMVLVGILLAIGLTSINMEARFVENRNDTRKNHIKTIEGAISQYRLQEGSYPAGLDRTYREICDPDASTCINFVDLKTLLVPKYLQSIPQDPNDTDNIGGTGYSIAVDSTTNTISIKSLQAESGAIIAVNDPLPAQETVTTNTPLVASVPVVPPTNIVTNGLVLHLDSGDSASYPGTGNTWFDLSGNNNNGELVNSPIYNLTNPNLKFFQFVNDDFIRIQNNTLLDTQTPSVEVWVKTNATIQNGFWFEKGAVNTQYSLFQEGPSILWRMNISGTTNLSTTTETYMNTTSWYQVVGTYTSGTRRLYINGVLVNSDNQSGTIATNAGGMSIGAYGGFNGARGYYYNGNLAICRVYNRALTASEIQQNFNGTRARFGL